MKLTSYLLPLILLCPAAVRADDWPQWLGPARDGSTTAKIAPWTDAPKEAWRVEVGPGHSSPVVADGRVFLHVKAKEKDKDEEQVFACDAATGKELWRQAYPRAPFKSPFGLGPRATPVVSDGRLYTFGVTGVLSCWEASSGKLHWQVDTLATFKAKNLFFGVSCSPLVDGDLILLNIGGPGASIVAFKKDTGAVAWKSLDDGASYSSPIVRGTGKDRHYVFLTHEGLIGVAPGDGALLWRYALVDKLSESSTTPTAAGDLLLASSVTFGSAGVKPGGAEAWKNPALTCYISTPAVVKDRVYLVTGTILPPPSATLRCVDPATGKELWSKAGVGRYHAALMRTADDRLLMLDDKGGLALLDPAADGYKELARSKVCGGTWAHPALANGRLYLRDNDALVALELK